MKDVQIRLLDLLYPKFIEANDNSQDLIIKLPYSLPINSYMYNIFLYTMEIFGIMNQDRDSMRETYTCLFFCQIKSKCIINLLKYFNNSESLL